MQCSLLPYSMSTVYELKWTSLTITAHLKRPANAGPAPRGGKRGHCPLRSDLCPLSFIFVFMVTNEMFNLLSGIRFGPIYGIFISVPLRVRSHIWDLECSVTT